MVKTRKLFRGEQTPESFWSWKPASPTPTYSEIVALGVMADSTTLEDWESLSPGMRREIVRQARK